jgi:NDP-sugar pyrophosphorylase family protein
LADAAGQKDCLGDIDIALLAGGLGTRVRDALGAMPKILAPLGDETLLDSQLRWLAGWGARRIVLCLGYRHEAVTEHLERVGHKGLDLIPSVEPAPLGTAGAVGFARKYFDRDTVLVMNGDTLLDGDVAGFTAAHQRMRSACTMLCVEVEDAGRFGRVMIGAGGEITGFAEKGRSGPGVVNAGAYLMSRAFLEQRIPKGAGSLEFDVFPAALDGSVRAHIGDLRVLDIGTHESLQRARSGRGNFIAATRQV